jgi:hypothetical protein
MSWNARALLIHADWTGKYATLLKKLGLTGGTPWEFSPVSFDSVPSLDTQIAIACVDGWTTLWSNLALDYLDHGAVKKLSNTSDVLLLTWQDAVGFGEFAWWSDGSLLRWRLVAEGKVRRDVGNPLRQEAPLFKKSADEQDRLWHLMKQLAIDPALLDEKVQFEVFDFPDITDNKPMDLTEATDSKQGRKPRKTKK